MSDNYLRVIPTDARYVPPADVAAVAAALVSRALPGADLVSDQHHGHPVFIDQGTNLEAIVCPACHSRLAFYGDPQSPATEEWWGQIPDPPEGQSIADVQVAMPCCGTAVPFPNLEFDWPAGVASFEINIRNPGIRGPLTQVWSRGSKRRWAARFDRCGRAISVPSNNAFAPDEWALAKRRPLPAERSGGRT